MTPHVCPICKGKRTVPGGFYRMTLEGLWTSYNDEPDEICRTCQGSGIVWEPEIVKP
jgi:hypothetical protein